MLDLTTLNDNQRLAVEWGEGPLLVLAGPGSGKTRVLTMRIARIAKESRSERFRILGLTFTNKAASEMRSRIDDLVSEGKERILLTTFHSFCADVLRQHGSHLGLRPDFAILTQVADQEEVLSDAIRTLDNDDNEIDIDARKVLPFIDKIFSNCINEDEIEDNFQNKALGRQIMLIFNEYKNQLVLNNRLDFGSILYLTDKLFTQKPRVTKQIRTVYSYICVDEYQDTNLAQYRILRAIAGDGKPNLFVVADDDQIIYQWNGASPERLRTLKDDYEMKVIQLPANYRCPAPVIHLANNLIRNNLDRSVGKSPLQAVKSDSNYESVVLKKFATFDEEAAWVASSIQERPAEERGKCVILARTTKLLQGVADALTHLGVPSHIAKRKNEFETVPMRWLHAMLRLANARNDREQLRRVCKTFYNLEGIDIRVEDVVAEASLVGGDFLRAWCLHCVGKANVEQETKAFLNNALNTLVDRLDYCRFIPIAFDWVKFTEARMASLSNDIFEEYLEEKTLWENLQLDVCDKFGGEHLALNAFLQEIDLSPKSPPPPKDAVQCLTIHSSKGMEFDYVYLVGLAEENLPSFQSIKKGDNSREMQEERRNCFVAITRCQKVLSMTYALQYFGWGKRPSRFLYEMGLLN